MLDYDFYVATPRLVITYFNANLESHIDFTVELYGARELAASTDKHTWVPFTREVAQKALQDRTEQLESTGFGRYLVSLLPESPSQSASGADPTHVALERVKQATPIGIVTLNLRGPESVQIPDLGFRIMSTYRGKGYAKEAAQGLLDYYEREKGVTEFLGYCEPENEPSKSVLRGTGFKDLGLRDIKGFGANGSALRLCLWGRGLKKEFDEYK